MKVRWRSSPMVSTLLLLGALPAGVFSEDVLETNGFSTCGAESDIKVNKMNIQYNKATQKVIFDVGGTSTKSQKVMASLVVSAYGKQVYQKSFDPCDEGTKVEQLCPVPQGTFQASGTQEIPTSFAKQIPAITFVIPDLDGTAKLELTNKDSGTEVACIQSVVGNGKTMSTKAVPIVAVGIAGAALLVSGLGSLAGAGSGAAGSASPSPTFTEVMGWFQSMAMNGMLSVQYPSVYRSFTKNFGFSGGLVAWDGMEISIDNFRKLTGGNLTANSVEVLRNTTLVYTDDTTSSNSTLSKRELEVWTHYIRRQISASANGTAVVGSGTTNTTIADSKLMKTVHGIQGYVEQLTIPQTNTFMTVLLIFAIVLASIIVGILLCKVILETWALFGSFPKRLTSFRKRYWWIMAKTITNLILVLYGVWVLYCVYQFTRGDSWAAKALAGGTLLIFTMVLLFFAWRIFTLARQYKKLDGDTTALYENKETWIKYSIFYDCFKKGYWWMFVPTIIYMFAKGCVIAGGDGHGMAQTIGQLIIEAIMLILLLWTRPYTLKSGNWINITIQVVRVLSVLCILVFVEQLGISQTPKTVTGVVLIVMQSVLTAVLAILIAVNALIACCRMNPHRKARKDAEKLNRDLDTLTPLDARNSLLLDPSDRKHPDPMVQAHPVSPPREKKDGAYVPYTDEDTTYHGYHRKAESQDNLLRGDHQLRPMGSNTTMREPLLPDLDNGYRGAGY
ncbi:TRP-domain-containing protein [Venturia nashicola]|uniref:TRP-domain-containing protein n=1 Tax=Venturia nashicola TaxID=86259 RepID=A0A4Z1PB79_9PEZI|nr:TRP-domain-containing protein [Venturia nashicola]TLD35261.1 TRP-domain-containing protein [Venturia nashicola]